MMFYFLPDTICLYEHNSTKYNAKIIFHWINRQDFALLCHETLRRILL